MPPAKRPPPPPMPPPMPPPPPPPLLPPPSFGFSVGFVGSLRPGLADRRARRENRRTNDGAAAVLCLGLLELCALLDRAQQRTTLLAARGGGGRGRRAWWRWRRRRRGRCHSARLYFEVSTCFVWEGLRDGPRHVKRRDKWQTASDRRQTHTKHKRVKRQTRGGGGR